MVTVPLETVQTSLVELVTVGVRPEASVLGDTENAATPKVFAPGLANVIDWDALVTVKLWVTAVAAL
jgi:hypothetical protein